MVENIPNGEYENYYKEMYGKDIKKRHINMKVFPYNNCWVETPRGRNGTDKTNGHQAARFRDIAPTLESCASYMGAAAYY